MGTRGYSKPKKSIPEKLLEVYAVLRKVLRFFFGGKTCGISLHPKLARASSEYATILLPIHWNPCKVRMICADDVQAKEFLESQVAMNLAVSAFWPPRCLRKHITSDHTPWPGQFKGGWQREEHIRIQLQGISTNPL